MNDNKIIEELREITKVVVFEGDGKLFDTEGVLSSGITLLKEIETITKITIFRCSIRDIQKILEKVSELSNLQSLNLMNNKLTKIPEVIGELDTLLNLNLSNNNITKLPESIVKLKTLRSLNLNSNNFAKIPEVVGELKTLQSLYLNYNYLTEISEVISELKTLQSLYLGYNNLTEIPEVIGELKTLQTLDLRGNVITEIPEIIGELKTLQSLYLSDNNLTEIPEVIGELKTLRFIFLANNQISKLPAVLCNIRQLHTLSINGNPFIEPPIEITRQGIGAIREYFRSLEQANKSGEGTETVYEAKLMIVGEPGAGKTTLRLKLKDPNADLPKEDKSTRGIDIEVWKYDYDSNNYTVNLWDFGGQQIYHSTHQFFMSERVLYVLIADSRKEDMDYFDWLYRIELFAGDSPVVIVHNEKDDRKREIDMSQIAKRFPNLPKPLRCNLAKISGTDREKDFDFVKKRIKQEISNLNVIGQKFPKSWIELREELERLVKDKKLNYILADEYYNICKAKYNINRDGALVLGNYLHAIGAILFFSDDPVLKNIVILNPKWGTDAVYKVIDDPKVQNDNGLFDKKDMARIWKDDKYDDKHHELLQLMMKFKICYEIPNDNGNYILPQLLPYQLQDYKWNEKDNLHFEYRYPDYYLKSIMVRFIVATHELIESQKTVWRNGVVLKKRGSRAEVIAYENKGLIQIRVSGTFRRDLLTIIRSHLDGIHSQYPKLKVEQMVPCNCDVCEEIEKPTFYLYSILYNRLENRKTTIECENPPFKEVNINQLISDIGLPRYYRKKEIESTQQVQKKWWQRAFGWFKGIGELAQACIAIIFLVVVVLIILETTNVINMSQEVSNIIDDIGKWIQ